jgi:hypothetical protein
LNVLADFTESQLAALTLQRQKPLLICDVDEVVVHFVRDFEDLLSRRKLRFQVAGFHLTGESVCTDDGQPLGLESIYALITEFFETRTRTMKPIEGAVESLRSLSKEVQLVFLTNLPNEAGDDRRANLRDFGLTAPVITNSGPKGPAIKRIAGMVDAAIAFVDDSPGFISSAHEFAAHVKTVHFLHDKRFHPYAPDFDFLGLRSDNWSETRGYLRQALTGAMARA